MKFVRWVFQNQSILYLALGTLFIFAKYSLAYNLDDFYSLEQGNQWGYLITEGDESYKETIKVEGIEMIEGVETVKMLSSDGENKCVAVDSEGIKIYKDFGEDGAEIYNPAKLILPNNIEMGEIGQFSITFIVFDSEGKKIEEGTESGQIQLDAVEKVEIDAGKFNNCLKFSMISDWKETDGDYGRDDCDIWLAPGIGKVKEFCINTEYDAEIKKEETSIEMRELISAVIDGRKIGAQ